MPNVKIYVDDTLFPDLRARLEPMLAPVRAMLCRELGVDAAACQVAVIPVLAMPDQPPINTEMLILPRPDRTREAVTRVGQRLRDMIGTATGRHVAVRVSALDPDTYVALK